MKINVLVTNKNGGVKKSAEALIGNLNSKFDISLSYFRADKFFLFEVIVNIFKLKGLKNNIFILHHFEMIAFGLMLKIFGFNKIINVVHTDLVGFYNSSGIFKRFIVRNIFFLIKKDLIVFVSQESMLNAKNFFRLNDVHCIYNFIDHNFFNKQHLDQVQSFDRQIKGPTKLGVVSRLEATKNIDLVMRVVKELNCRGIDAELIIFGKGSQNEVLIKYIDDLNCGSFIRIAGFDSDLSQVYNRIDALISLSRIEGLPTVIFESVFYKKPIFFADCISGPREIMSPNSDPLKKTNSFEITEFGYLVKPVSVNPKTSYSKFINPDEICYVDYLENFICQMRACEFVNFELHKKFSSDLIYRNWAHLINRFS
jgi:N-acetylgalactosamine-N,N'-diacetylbacillosaminyl-diphospho-undecaprenol 4-alpha-N-acetylgalactosaminyltransferase